MAVLNELRASTGHHETSDLTSQACTPDMLAREVNDLDVRALRSGAFVIVETHNSRYRIVKLAGNDRSILVQGGRLFPELTQARLDGSTQGGSALHIGSIDVGSFLELSVAGERVVTSRVRSISVEPTRR